MRTSARNQFVGEVVDVKHGAVNDEIVLRRVTGDLSLSRGQRKSVLRLPLTDLNPGTTLLSAQCGPITAQSLLAEPKQLELAPAAPLSVSLEADGLIELGCSTPVLDLVLTDAEGTAAFLDNCVTVLRPGVVRLRYRGLGRGLEARSLSGPHRLTGLPGRLV